MDILGRVIRIIEKIIRGSSRVAIVVGLGILMLMALLTLADVVGRSGFNKPITGAYEFTELLFVVVVACVLGYSVILKSHVKIDVLVSHFPTEMQAAIDTVGYLVSSAFFFLVSSRVALQAIRVKSQEVTSGILGIPIYPFQLILAFGCFLIGAMFLIEFFRSFSKKTANGETDR